MSGASEKADCFGLSPQQLTTPSEPACEPLVQLCYGAGDQNMPGRGRQTTAQRAEECRQYSRRNFMAPVTEKRSNRYSEGGCNRTS